MMIANSTAATSPPSYTEFVLAELKCAGLRARLLVADIDSIDVALRGEFIDVDSAIAWANESVRPRLHVGGHHVRFNITEGQPPCHGLGRTRKNARLRIAELDAHYDDVLSGQKQYGVPMEKTDDRAEQDAPPKI